MFVQEVVLPGSRRESWTVLYENGRPVEPVERYLGYLSDIERRVTVLALHPTPPAY